MLGLTQQQMAELIGVTYQQAHKYEKGINRIAGGRLYQIAQALGVEVSYFYDGIDGRSDDFKPTPQQRLLLELARNFTLVAKSPAPGGDLRLGPCSGGPERDSRASDTRAGRNRPGARGGLAAAPNDPGTLAGADLSSRAAGCGPYPLAMDVDPG